MNRHAAIALAWLALVAAACSPRPADSPSPRPERTAGPAPSSSALEAAATARDARPFGRRDAPPGGVEALLEFTSGGGDFCHDLDEPLRPRLTLLIGLSGLPIGACGFDLPSAEDADLTIEGPGGWRWSGREAPDQSGTVSWSLDDLPSPIDGRYGLRASQGDLLLEATFLLELDDLHAVVLPRTARVGRPVRVFVAGARGSQAASAFLYRADTAGYGFAAEIGPIELDENGEGRLELPTRPGDEDGYVVVVRLGEAGDGAEVLSGTLDDYRAASESHGLGCAEVTELLSCDGTLGSTPFHASMWVTDDRTVRTVEGRGPARSREVIGWAAGVGGIATGTGSVGSWIESLPPGPLLAERRFGGLLVAITEEVGSWSLRIVPPAGLTRAARSDFTVER